MNKLIMTGLGLAGAVILTDHMIFSLPHYAAVILYTAAIVMIIAGMIRSRKSSV
ncbi:MAG: hypothetical protein K6G61_10265 [Solobacterium sp.]|nr:hypothetical protein [Solobacterium sp.]